MGTKSRMSLSGVEGQQEEGMVFNITPFLLVIIKVFWKRIVLMAVQE